mgnify:FL=1
MFGTGASATRPSLRSARGGARRMLRSRSEFVGSEGMEYIRELATIASSSWCERSGQRRSRRCRPSSPASSCLGAATRLLLTDYSNALDPLKLLRNTPVHHLHHNVDGVRVILPLLNDLQRLDRPCSHHQSPLSSSSAREDFTRLSPHLLRLSEERRVVLPLKLNLRHRFTIPSATSHPDGVPPESTAAPSSTPR